VADRQRRNGAAGLAADRDLGELAERLETCGVSQLPILSPGGDLLGWAGDLELPRVLRQPNGAEKG